MSKNYFHWALRFVLGHLPGTDFLIAFEEPIVASWAVWPSVRPCPRPCRLRGCDRLADGLKSDRDQAMGESLTQTRRSKVLIWLSSWSRQLLIPERLMDWLSSWLRHELFEVRKIFFYFRTVLNFVDVPIKGRTILLRRSELELQFWMELRDKVIVRRRRPIAFGRLHRRT